jgi:hypothetical protein
VLSGAGCNHSRVDHAVLLVGYGVDTSIVPWLPYWKLRNSWGPAFGEGGYVRIQAGVKCPGTLTLTLTLALALALAIPLALSRRASSALEP